MVSVASIVSGCCVLVIGAIFGTRYSPPNCQTDLETLDILRTQLARCGPDQLLHAAPVQGDRTESRPFLTEVWYTLLAVLLGLVLGRASFHITLVRTGGGQQRALQESDEPEETNPALGDAPRWRPSGGQDIRRIHWR